MSDHLEDFIRRNRDEFDDREPSGKVWTGIAGGLGLDKKRVSLWNSAPLWRAAAIVFMALTVYLLVPKKEAHDATALGDFKDVEAFYTR